MLVNSVCLTPLQLPDGAICRMLPFDYYTQTRYLW